MSKEIKKLHLSWDTIHDGVESLAYMAAARKPKLIVGIARGGLIPATMLSHHLQIPMLTLNVQSYDKNNKQGDLQSFGWDSKMVEENVLFVDDIIDSGKTAFHIFDKNPEAFLLTLVNKVDNRFETPTKHNRDIFHFCQVPKDVWVQFPWER